MQFLFERLANPPLPVLGHFETTDTKAAIAAQIQRIVSARVVDAVDEAYGAGSLLDFGLPHVVELALNNKAHLERYAAKLKRLIERYEPRLLRPAISIESTGKALMPYRLLVSGSLSPDTEPEMFSFELPAR